jgi:4-hydroxybenzoate polyprenyltransferase
MSFRAAVVSSKPAHFARLIKVEHSVYALPFADAGALLAERRVPAWQALAWITLAMVAARSAAMALNRLIDAELDARNPRTAARELPMGLLRKGEVVAFIVVSLALLILAAFELSAPCRYLWPIPVAAFVLYPYAKRFTALCHYILGLTDGLAPAAAWIAVSGRLALPPILLFLAVGVWVGGFDIIYAVFDLDFDRREGIRSIPVALGVPAAMTIAAASHLAAVGLLFWAGAALHLPWEYFAGCGLVAALLAASHADIAIRGLRRVGMAFMTANGLVSVVYLAVVLPLVLKA